MVINRVDKISRISELPRSNVVGESFIYKTFFPKKLDLFFVSHVLLSFQEGYCLALLKTSPSQILLMQFDGLKKNGGERCGNHKVFPKGTFLRGCLATHLRKQTTGERGL